jgi:alginate O-acetyltransferase complex protein AlgI
MLFSSYEFIFLFLPLALILYFALSRLPLKALATGGLILISLVFYGFHDWHAIFMLLGSILLNYALAYLLRRDPKGWLLILGIGLNLTTLGYFKYLNFLIGTINTVAALHLPMQQIVLPLGISFFTFAQIAFLVDTARGETEHLSFFSYMSSVCFFPYIISGPIVHYQEIISQFSRPEAKRWIPANVHAGTMFFSLGLAKKVLIANLCGPWADAAFNNISNINALEAWLGTLAYTMQLYFDFSGYSDMAIGLAMLFNVRLPENFNAPYKSASIIEFWQRWHMTLSQFLRDHVYTPLAFSFRTPPGQVLSIILTMLLCGLWHGAAWTFVIWGGYHGILLVIAAWWQSLRRPLPIAAARMLTFLAVLAGWILFRSKDLAGAISVLTTMVHFGNLGSSILGMQPPAIAEFIVLLSLLAFVNLSPTTKDWVESRVLNARHAIFAGILVFVCLLCMRTSFMERAQSPFLYFQF